MSDDTTTHLPVAGLDVHAASIRLAVVREDELLDERTLPFDCQLVGRELRRLGATRVCYEAGPTGFGLARHLRDAGLQCDVIAPGLVPRRGSDRVKTDKRDARKLALLYQGGMLVSRGPDADREERQRPHLHRPALPRRPA
jgi:transposase